MSKTVLLTGISGFIAKRIAHDLLAKGYTVVGSVRSMARAGEVRAAVGPAGLDRLRFVELDLTRDEGWSAAMQGVDVLMHTASPFPMSIPKDEGDVIRPAVDGTLRAMRAAKAAGLTRVVLTASMATIAYSRKPYGYVFGPEDWTDVNWRGASVYIRSKTLAEQAAREFAAAQDGMALTTIHPGLVCGTPMDRHFGTSLRLIRRILSGKDPVQPDMPMSIVDVEDLSALHIAAMEQDSTIGQRLIASDKVLSFPEIAAVLAAAFPERKVTTRVAPRWLLNGFALFNPAVKSILPLVGTRFGANNSASLPYLPNGFVTAEESILRSARFVAAMNG